MLLLSEAKESPEVAWLVQGHGLGQLESKSLSSSDCILALATWFSNGRLSAQLLIFQRPVVVVVVVKLEGAEPLGFHGKTWWVVPYDGADPLQVSQGPCALWPAMVQCPAEPWTMAVRDWSQATSRIFCSAISFFPSKLAELHMAQSVNGFPDRQSEVHWKWLAVFIHSVGVCISVDFGFLCSFLITWLCNNFFCCGGAKDMQPNWLPVGYCKGQVGGW